MVKLGFTGVYIIFLVSAQKHGLWVLVRTASEAVLTSTHNLCFEQKHEKYQNFLSENYHFFFKVKFSVYLNRHVFVMFLFYFIAAGGKCRVATVKRLPVLHHSADYSFIFFSITEPILVTLKIEYRLRCCFGGGGICSLANYKAAHEEIL